MPSLTTRIAAHLALIPAGTLAGALSGGLVNIVNCLFVPLMLWGLAPVIADLQAPIRQKIILQGVLEGSVLGTFSGFCFAVTVLWVSRLQCPFSLAVRYIPLAH